MLGVITFDMSLAETELAAIQSLQWMMFSGHAALLATAAFALAAVLLLLSQRRARRLSVSSPAAVASAHEHLPLPPGPRGYPLIGYLGLLKIFENPRKLLELQEQYGNVISYPMFGQRIVLLSGADVIRNALQDEALAGRPGIGIAEEITKGWGLGRSEGLLWRTHRRFMLRTFHDMGVSREVIERRLLCGVGDQLVEELSTAAAAAGGEAIDPEPFVTRALGRVMLKLLWGFDAEFDVGYEQLLWRLQDSLKMVGKTSSIFALIAYRFHRWLPGDAFSLKRILENERLSAEYLLKRIDERRRALASGARVEREGIVDAFLAEQSRLERELRDGDDDDAEAAAEKQSESESRANTNAKANETPHLFPDVQLMRATVDLAMAGSDTTASVLRWALYAMAKRPAVQRRVRAELDAALHGERVSFGDRTRLPYTQAVMCEVLRVASLLSVGLHRTVRATSVEGYKLPADAFVFSNLYGLNRDPRLWRSPHAFDVGHFFDEASGQLLLHNHFLPFSAGKRSCLGEALARQQSFLLFARLMQAFEVSFSEHDHDADSMPDEESFVQPNTLIRTLRPFSVRFRPLQQSAAAPELSDSASV